MVRIIDRSLVEQMGLTEAEIERRLHLIDFDEPDRQALLACQTHIDQGVGQVIDRFYKTQLENSEVSSIIGDIDTLKRLEQTMREYTRSLFDGVFDETYINNRLRIGKVHKRLGVTPRLYISGIATLQRLLEEAIDDFSSPAEADVCKKALRKVLLFDVQLVFEAYIDSFLVEMEAAKDEVEEYAASLGVRIDAQSRHLHEISTRDALTGLYNRRAFLEHLERECVAASRHKLPLTLVYMDLNGFKPVNDEYGHEAGDTVLRHIGEAMLEATRAVDIAVRYGGDEFCIILPRTTAEEVDPLLQRLMDEFDRREQFNVTFSIGVAQTGPDTVEKPTSLIQRADHKMYAAKARARKDGLHHVEK